MNNNLSSSGGNQSQADNSFPVKGVFVDLQYVLDNKDRENVILIDARPETKYLEGHIPGAICMGKGSKMPVLVVKDLLLHVKSADKLAKIFGDKGIKRDSEIITYGAKSEYYAIYINWVLELLGADKVCFYNNGINGAKRANIKLATEPTTLMPVVFEPQFRNKLIITTEEVIKNEKSKEAVLIDIRPKAEVYGDDIRSLRGGKIPGAIHFDIENNWVGMKTKDLKPVTELKDIYSSLAPARDIILTCQIGIRTTYVYYILKALGYTRIRNHEESWIIWGNRFDLPAEHERPAKLGQMAINDLLRSIFVFLKNMPRWMTSFVPKGSG